MPRRTRALAGLLLAALLAGCGFALRGAVQIPYDPIYLDLPTHSTFAAQLRRAIAAQGSTRLADSADGAVAILTPTGEFREKTILSLNSAGRVREYQLRYRYGYRIHDRGGRDLAEPATIVLTRDLTFDDAAVLAKEQEEALLWRDMEADLVQQILRRLAAAPRPASAEPR